MRKTNLLLISFVAIFISSTAMPAKVPDSDFEIGIGGGAALGFMESEVGDLSASGSIFMQTSLTAHVRTEFGLGKATLKGENYTTNIVPFRERFLFYPMITPYFSPYIHLGVGGTFYTITQRPPGSELTSGERDFTPLATTGFGFEVESRADWTFDLSCSYVHSFTNDLNAIGVQKNDSYFEIMAGFKVPIDLKIKPQVVVPVNRDIDSDGITNTMEDSIGTDKNNPDTDSDGLGDGKEINIHKTDPLKADTDGDCLSDGDEIKTHKTDPLKADTDGDGLNDKDEIETYKTNPFKADTDGDGLEDKAEVETHKTDPLKIDSDWDNLSDADEINVYKTDPLSKDTDGGSIDDFTEVDRGTDPLNRADDIIEEVFEIVKDAKITLEGIVFNSGSADILPASVEVLEKTYRTLDAFNKVNIEIQGYTDNTGNLDFNLVLSQKRADSVRNWLIEKGIDAGRITAKGFGPENPVESNDTREGRQKNRRIEFIRIY